MAEFDPMRINIYQIEELADMVEQGTCQLGDLYMCGLSFQRRTELANLLKERETLRNEDDERWIYARQQNTVPAYRSYLSKYDRQPPQYRGKHVAEARYAIEDLEADNVRLKEELFQTMRERPGLFNAGTMRELMGIRTTFGDNPDNAERGAFYDDIVSRFVASGQSISHKELIDQGIIPSCIKNDALIAEDIKVDQTRIEHLGDFPDDKRTDVYFWGVPRSGKSAVLSGILSYMNKKGIAEYVPHWNSEDQDMVRRYYYKLIDSTSEGRFLESTGADTVSFLKLDLEVKKRENKLTFVELGGEAFRAASDSGFKGKKAWGKLGAGTCLESNNRKLLFFIIDYSMTIGENNMSSESNQREILEAALDILSSDGDGKNGEKGCTFSKIDTVAIILNKSDIMNESDEEKKSEIAIKYVGDKFAAFMSKLEGKCRYFGVNKPVGYRPYIMPFSIGRKLIGNLYEYDPRDSKKVVEFISDVTSGEDTGFLGRLLGNG